jgi:hypothetical protein
MNATRRILATAGVALLLTGAGVSSAEALTVSSTTTEVDISMSATDSWLALSGSKEMMCAFTILPQLESSITIDLDVDTCGEDIANCAHLVNGAVETVIYRDSYKCVAL